MRIRIAPLPILLAAALSAHAAEPGTHDAGAIAWEANARLRTEHVDDAAFARDAWATTLRLRAGLRWTISPAFDAFVEGEAVGAANDAYNSTANRRTAYPVIADPQGAEINQAWLRWQDARGDVTAGRQRIAHDNQRWIGNVGWRQNEQTFDAITGTWQPTTAVVLRAARIERVHRVNSDRALDPLARERDLQGNVLNASWTGGAHRLTGYVHAIEDEDVPAMSTRTLGLRYALAPAAGTRPWGVTLEGARQRDHAGNPLSFSHGYWLVEPSLAMRAVTLRAGREHLGGDGRHALQTPLATLHAFNGWADRFTVTPASGLDDRYLSANGSLLHARAQGGLEWTLAWHDYRADTGGARLGREANASLSLPLRAGLRATAKLADYRANAFGANVRKAWLQLEWARPARRQASGRGR